MDHYLGQDKFPQYAIHPKNLIPCCTACNSNKGEDLVDQQGIRTVLNVYTDPFPTQRYLYANFDLDGNEIVYTFSLINNNGIDANLWALVTNHFKELKLLDRLKTDTIKPFTEFRSLMMASLEQGTAIPEITATVMGAIQRDRLIFGNNAWSPALQEAAVNSPLFWQDIQLNP